MHFLCFHTVIKAIGAFHYLGSSFPETGTFIRAKIDVMNHKRQPHRPGQESAPASLIVYDLYMSVNKNHLPHIVQCRDLYFNDSYD